jgi:hypothetical protein
MKFSSGILIFLILNLTSFSQVLKNNLSAKYEKGIHHYLSPVSAELLFLSISRLYSESSVALETTEANSILKFRSFRNNYWDLVLSKSGDKSDLIISKTDSISVYISKEFENKLMSFFQSALKDTLVSPRADFYDGTVYRLNNSNYKREVYDYDFQANKRYFNLIKTFEGISTDLKKGTFTEAKYLDRISRLSSLDY